MPPPLHNQGPIIPRKPRTIGRITRLMFRYLWALAQLAGLLIVVAVVAGIAYIGLRAVVFAVKTVTQALGI